LRQKVNDAIKHYEGIWLEIFREGVEDGVFRKDMPLRIVLNAIFGMCNWTHQWYNPDGLFSPAEIGETFAKIALESIINIENHLH